MRKMQEQQRLNLCMMRMNMGWNHCGHLIWPNIKVRTQCKFVINNMNLSFFLLYLSFFIIILKK